MSITLEEKEALYEEFKERMLNERSSGAKEIRNLGPARDYFNEEKTKLQKEGSWNPDLYDGWAFITKLTYRVVGVRYVRDIPDEKLGLANDFAKEVIKLYYEYYKKGLDS